MQAIIRLAAAFSILAVTPFAAGSAFAAVLLVSTAGDDSTGDGSPLLPFRTLQAAHDAAAAKDTLMATTAGNLGSTFLINKSLNIQGVPGAGLYDSTPGVPCITVTAPGATVSISGLTCDKMGSVNHGILINAAHKLNVSNSIIRGGTGGRCGIFAQPDANFELNISNSTMGPFGTAGAGGGICIVPRSGADVSGAFEGLHQQNGQYGIRSVAGSGSLINISVMHSTISGNTTAVLSQGTGSNLFLGGNTVSGNTTGLTRTSGGKITSLTGNSFAANTSGDGAFSATIAQK